MLAEEEPRMRAWSSLRRFITRRVPGVRVKSAADDVSKRTRSHPFDLATGLDTAGLIQGSALASGHPHDRHSVSYYATAPSLFFNVMARWGGNPAAYTFVDLGCGKGRAVLLASQLGFRECIGVELNPHLAAVAVGNAARWQHNLTPVRILCGDATEVDFPAGRCLLYLFNPFTGEVLERLLERIAVVYAHRPRELDLVYVNPEFSALLATHAGFELLWEMPVVMSAEDAAADLLYVDGQAYGGASCSGWRWSGL